MASASELIRAVEEAGGRFKVDGDRLAVAPREAVEPVLEELCRHMPEIIELLSRRPKIPAGLRLIHWEPKAAPLKLSRWESINDIDLFVQSTLRQVECRLRGKDWRAGNWTLSALLERLAAVGCIVELDDPTPSIQ